MILEALFLISGIASFLLFIGLMRQINHREMHKYLWLGPFALFFPNVLSDRGKIFLSAFLLNSIVLALVIAKLFGPV